MSNRLPVAASKDGHSLVPSSGGLVTAIRGIHCDTEILWAGCAPSGVSHTSWRTLYSSWRGKEKLQPIFLDPSLYDSYYNGYCNNLLWPLFHYESNRATYSEKSWHAYIEVNKRFAACVNSIAKPGDIVWVQDFHLFLVPKFLRELRRDLKIGFFLHIPFPSSEIFRQIPHRKELLQGVLQADLVGFHDYSYLRHFGSSLLRVLGIDSAFNDVVYRGQKTRLGVFPVSIDTKYFERLAKSPAVAKQQRKLKSNCFTFLGVDRLDYSKGLKLKLEAYQLLLRNNPALQGRVRLIQLAIPTRTGVAQYRNLKRQIDLLVGEINGEFGTTNWVPITYIYNQVSQKTLAALYRSANALLVTSLRDGMNLVTLEYIACQSAKNPGLAILSEFTGALSMLNRTITINPWDTENTARNMMLAVEMPVKERRERWKSMIQFLEQYDASVWAGTFINQLGRHDSKLPKAKVIEPSEDSVTKILSQLRLNSPKELSLIIDYDGTLVPIEDRPEKATMDYKTRRLLTRLSSRVGHLLIVSGRPRDFMVAQLKGVGATLVAEHGSFVLGPNDHSWARLIPTRSTNWYSSAHKIMQDYAIRVPNSFVERKTFSIVWHYRLADQEYADFQSHKLHEELEITLANAPVTVIRGNKIIEVRAVEANKGYFVAKLLNQPSVATKALVFGDDRTDEDMYPEVRGRGFSFRVGLTTNTMADFCIPSQPDVLLLLSLLERECDKMYKRTHDNAEHVRHKGLPKITFDQALGNP